MQKANRTVPFFPILNHDQYRKEFTVRKMCFSKQRSLKKNTAFKNRSMSFLTKRASNTKTVKILAYCVLQVGICWIQAAREWPQKWIWWLLNFIIFWRFMTNFPVILFTSKWLPRTNLTSRVDPRWLNWGRKTSISQNELRDFEIWALLRVIFMFASVSVGRSN